MNKLFLVNGPPPTLAQAKSSRRWFNITNQTEASKPAEILIYDFIGKDTWSNTGISAKEFADELKAIPTDSKINIRINSQGGNVWDGLAIYNMLQPRRDKITCYIDGIAASAASWIALAGSKTVIPKNAFMMIHETKAMFYGTADDIESQLPAIRKHDELIVNIYEQKTGKPRSDIEEKMKAETWFTGDEAKAFGLADEVTDEIVLTACAQFDLSLFRRVPESLGGKAAPAINNKQKGTTMDTPTIPAGTAPTTPQPANTAPPAPPAAPTPVIDQAMLTNMANQFTAMTAAMAAMKKTEITNRVKRAADECRIPVDQIDAWVARGEKDETVLNDLEKLPQHLPGRTPIGIETISADIRNVANVMGRRQDPTKPEQVREIAIQNAAMFRDNREKLIGVWNTNTIDSTLQQAVILQQALIAFKKRMLPLSAFSTVFSNVVLKGDGTIVVPYYALETAASTNFSSSYSTGNTTSDKKVITVNKRKYQGFSFTGDEWTRQPWLNIETQATLKAGKLAYDIIADVLSVVTNAHFSTAAFVGAYSGFDYLDLVDIRKVCTAADWPLDGRSLILDEDYYAELLKDTSVSNAAASGNAAALRQGAVGNLAGFNIYEFPYIPDNSENLVGFASFVSGILFASSPVQPPPAVLAKLYRYQLATDPETGITLQYRHWGTESADTDYEIIESAYGYDAGEAAAVKRITSA